jgi:hypothetical protein
VPHIGCCWQCTAHQTELNFRSTGKSFVHRSLPAKIIRLKRDGVSIREPFERFFADKLFSEESLW